MECKDCGIDLEECADTEIAIGEGWVTVVIICECGKEYFADIRIENFDPLE